MNYWQLIQLRAAIRLEKVGMRHSSGKSARLKVAKLFGMKHTASHDEVINELNKVLKL